MKNFEMRYPIIGTSALQPKFDHPSSSTGFIIEFPARSAAGAANEESCTRLRDRVLDSEMVRSLRFDSAKGRAYGRIAPWQAALAGIVFAMTAFVVLVGA